MPAAYDTRLLAAEIRNYFETYDDALEVLIFKGHKMISIDRIVALNPMFYRLLKRKYEK